jgi:hypothetical protein
MLLIIELDRPYDPNDPPIDFKYIIHQLGECRKLCSLITNILISNIQADLILSIVRIRSAT